MFQQILKTRFVKPAASFIAAPALILLTACGGVTIDVELDEPIDVPTIPVVVNNAPSVVISGPAAGTQANAGEAILFTATANDEEDGDLSGNIQWESDVDGALGSGASLSAILSEGSHTVTARITDSGQASAQSSVVVSIVAGQPVNTAPTVYIDSPSNGDSFTAGISVTLTAVADDAEDGDLSGNVQWSSDIDGFLGEGASLPVLLSAGSHVITAQVADSADAVANHNITIDVIQPAGMATLSWTAPTLNTDDSQLDDLAGFKIHYGTQSDNLNLMVEINDPAATSHVIEDLQNQTTYYFSVTAFNASGVESDLSSIVSKTIQ